MSVTAPSTDVARPRAATARDPFLDNARYWVMLLVVVGHFLTALLALDEARAAYRWIYLFHMPVFILISGYLGRRYSGTPREVRRMVGTLVVPYLLVEIGLEAFEAWLADEPLSLHVLEPEWLTWFIAALFVWRLTTPIWRAVRWPIPVAIGCSLVGGLAPVSDVLAIPQIIGYLPFYVVGMQLRREHFERLRDLRVRIGALAVLGAAAYACVQEPEHWTMSWLYWRDAYSESPLDAGALDGIATRGALLAIGFVLAAAVLALVPHRRAWYSTMGQRTLYCYLLHGFVVLALSYYGAFSYLGDHGSIGIGIAALAALVLANLLMTRAVSEGFRPLFEPRLRWLFRADGDAESSLPHR
ncbi:acyltransferase family protein [Solicola gregarius]|uniref:Acyltransferase family protein n=1 Tax=Solicola gregarius TaxID=2908642 RepID=A0AA46YIX6_9ACTN|nr:acyltransferase family protein [Solicola gregarius]UYM03735.1 acyltransferase family protein [Solicola gregarius]